MANKDLLSRYNYDAFIPENFEPWMNFDRSPAVGQKAPDFPLWDLEGKVTSLQALWSARDYLIVEFGSFT